MRSRDEIYLDILSAGLLAIRAAGWSNNAQICAIEADHLHNIPSLIDEKNELRHQYYFDAERTGYIERIAIDGLPDGTCSWAANRYKDYWKELAEYIEKNNNDA